MTALAEQLSAGGFYPSTTTADLAITAGQVYKDSNGYVRCAGTDTTIQADIRSASQVASLTLNPAYSGCPVKGSGANKW